MTGIEIAAAVFGGISAVNAITSLFITWKKKFGKAKAKESAEVERALVSLPAQLESRRTECLRDIGMNFAGKDAHRSIQQYIALFTRTMHKMLDVALLGRSLDLCFARDTIEDFRQNLLNTLISLRPSPRLRDHNSLALTRVEPVVVDRPQSTLNSTALASSQAAFKENSKRLTMTLQRIQDEAVRSSDKPDNGLKSLTKQPEEPLRIEHVPAIQSLPSFEMLRSMQETFRTTGHFC